MKELSSSYGRVFIGPKEECYRTAVFLAEGMRGKRAGVKHFSWALTGGSTPKDWYQWCVAKDALSPPLVAASHWFTSDERHMPLEHGESNFGNAERLLLGPLKVPADRKHPWPVSLPAPEAAEEFERQTEPWLRRGTSFDVCFLGLGDDCHTASIFPGSPLLLEDGGSYFAAVEVPGKGWRLTITPTGLRACSLIVVMALGAGKADALHRVHSGPLDPSAAPAQVLRTCAPNVVWLVDEPAAAKILKG